MPFHAIVGALTTLSAAGALMSAATPRTLLAIALTGAVGGALLGERPWSWCPPGAATAQRIELNGSFADVVLDGERYRVGGHALLDHMPRIVLSPLDLRAVHHPIGVTASISATSREALGEPVFTCFRVASAGDIWARRPTTHGTQTMADGYPPGAPPPVPNEAWRQASANDGPEWSAGEMIRLELWLSLGGRDHVFVLPPFALMKGG